MPKPEFDAETGKILNPILAIFRAELESMIIGHSATAYISGSAQMVEFGKTLKTMKPIYFEGPPTQEAIKYAQRRAAQLVTQMEDETKRQLAQVIADGIENKRGIPGLSRDIRTTFDDMTKYRSQMIARTETADSLSQGAVDRMKDMGVTGKSWVTFHPCEICEENERAGVIPFADEFPSGHLRPPAHPQCRCHPFDTTIQADNIERIYRRWYEGNLIQITTSLGNKLSGTPNHPILSDRGWVSMASLMEGDHIISTDPRQRVFGINPNVDNIPSRIGDIFNTLTVICPTERVIGTPVDFHGDGREEQIDVVTVDNSLPDREHASILEHLHHSALTFPHRQMGLASSDSPLAGVEEPQSICLATTSYRDVGCNESCPDDISINPEGFTEGQFGFPGDISLDDRHLVDAKIGSPCGRAFRHAHVPSFLLTSEHASLLEDIGNSPVSDVVPSGDRLNAIPGTVIIDRIVDIRLTRFSHYVYNLQTKSGWYVANNIISHNCALAPAMLREK